MEADDKSVRFHLDKIRGQIDCIRVSYVNRHKKRLVFSLPLFLYDVSIIVVSIVRVQCCFTSTETIRRIRDGEPMSATSTFTQLLGSAFIVWYSRSLFITTQAVMVNTVAITGLCTSDTVADGTSAVGISDDERITSFRHRNYLPVI